MKQLHGRDGRALRWASRAAGRLVLCVSLTGLVAMPALAQRDEGPSAEAMAADVLLARPLGIVATTLGAAVFVVSLPFSAAGGNVEEAAETLVVGPARETFARCLGCRTSGRYQRPRDMD